MKTNFEFSIDDTPTEFSLSKLLQLQPTNIFGSGIVNPMGPTASFLATGGSIKLGKEVDLFQVILSPFNQSCLKVGKVKTGEAWNAPRDLFPFFTNLDWGDCPTLLFPSPHYCKKTANEIFAQFFLAFDDFLEVAKKVEEFEGDPLQRIKSEIEESIYGTRVDEENLYPSREFLIEAAFKLSATQLNTENMIKEMLAFLYAWQGSLEFVSEKAMEVDSFFKILCVFVAFGKSESVFREEAMHIKKNMKRML